MTKLRQDRFFSSIPGVTDETFNRSNFLKLYNQTEKQPSYQSVVNTLLTLPKLHDRSHPIIQCIQNEPESYDVVKTFTSEFLLGSDKFYKYINQKLVNDKYHELKKLMPYIRRATRQINYHTPNTNCILYRGMYLNDEQIQFFTIGKYFRFPGFTSTTQNPYVAQQFGNIIFMIHLIAPCHQVINMTHFSFYPHEQEWLFSPYSRFQVIDRKPNLIILKSIDNLATILQAPVYKQDNQKKNDDEDEYDDNYSTSSSSDED